MKSLIHFFCLLVIITACNKSETKEELLRGKWYFTTFCNPPGSTSPYPPFNPNPSYHDIAKSDSTEIVFYSDQTFYCVPKHGFFVHERIGFGGKWEVLGDTLLSLKINKYNTVFPQIPSEKFIKKFPDNRIVRYQNVAPQHFDGYYTYIHKINQ